MPAGERFFRRIWLGPIGSAFLGLAARGVDHAASVASGAVHAFAKLTPSPVTGVRPIGGRSPLPTGRVTAPVTLVATSATASESPTQSALHANGAQTVSARAPENGEVHGDAGARPEDTIARLERRVEALEEWRKEREVREQM